LSTGLATASIKEGGRREDDSSSPNFKLKGRRAQKKGLRREALNLPDDRAAGG